MIQILSSYGGLLLRAMGQTCILALWGLFFGSLLGLIFGILGVMKNRVCQVIQQVFVTIIRGIPMMVLAMFVFFGVPYAFKNIIGVNLTLSALQAGTICLALNSGAYMAEIIRAGIQSVDKGQMEAARSLGLPYWRAMQRVVLPQAIRTMIPTIVNQFIITLKDTSILSAIGFPELVNSAKNVVANTFMSFQTWLIVGIMSVLHSRVCRIIAAVFVNLIRGVPMIVLAYFIFFGVPYLWNTILGVGGLTLTALQAGSICLALNCGAYMAEIIRAGIESVDVGQMEAARSLGLPWWRAMQRVVLPQAIRTMIPSIINQFIITLKDTSILSVIGFPELVNTAKNVVAATFMSFQTWAIVGLMYLIVILLLQRAAKVLERRLKYGA